MSRKVDDIPKKYRANYDAAMQGNSRKKAIRANCLFCMGWDSSEVKACTDRECTLWKFRLRG